MRQEGGLLQAIVLVLMTAGLVYVPLSRSVAPRRSESPAGVGDAPATTAPQRLGEMASLVGGTGSPSGEGKDALALLAEFFNLDLSAPAIMRAMDEALSALAPEATAAGPAYPEDGQSSPRDVDRGLESERRRAANLLRGLPEVRPEPPPEVRDALAGLFRCGAPPPDAPVSPPDCGAALRRDTVVVRAWLAREGELPDVSPAGASDPPRTAAGSPPRPRGALAEPTGRTPIQEAIAFSVVKRLVAERYQFDVLVATAADACDSFSGSAFDPTVESIRRALEVPSYLLDRFYLPDWNPAASMSQTGSRCSGRLHERQPAVVLFRRDKPPDPAWVDPPSLLLLLIVPETPTTGIQPRAFVSAVRFITRWDRTAAPANPTKRASANTFPEGYPSIRIIGPSFSGSAPSLARTIGALPPGFASEYAFRIVAGGATSPLNARILSLPKGPGHGPVTFQAATLDDDTFAEAMNRFLESRGVQPHQAALVVESNTGYGAPMGPCLERDANGWCTDAADRKVPLQFPFPMHVARIREQPAQARPASQLAVATAPDARPLAFEETQPPEDLLPPTRPDATAPNVELLLRNMLTTIEDAGSRGVGLFATDIRDKLFLVREIRRRAPNAAIFTSEADLLFTHPSFTAFTRGMFVVSSYPGYSRNQLWTVGATGRSGRLEFATMAAQGTYNATLLQLWNLRMWDDHYWYADPSGKARMVPFSEYSFPFDNACAQPPGSTPGGCHPHAWVSVVGRNRVWPVKAYAVTGEVTGPVPGEPVGYVRAVGREVMDPMPPRVALARPSAALAAFVLLTIVVTMHVLAYVLPPGLVARWTYFRRFRRTGSAASSPAALAAVRELFRDDEPDRARALLACFVALTLLYVFSAGVFWTWIVFGEAGWTSAGLAAVVVATALGCVAITLHAGWRALAVFGEAARSRRSLGSVVAASRAGYALAIVAIVSIATWHWLRYIWQVLPGHVWPVEAAGASDLDAILYFERTTALGSGVSPAVPLFCLAAAGYLWGVLRLRRLGLAREVRLGDRLDVIERLALGDIAGTRFAVPLPVWVLFMLAAVAAVFLVLFGGQVPVTVEPVAYGWLCLWSMLLFQITIGAATLRLVYYRRMLQDYLDRLAGHPILQVYKRLPKELLAPANFIRAPRLADAEPLVARWQGLSARLVSVGRAMESALGGRAVEAPAGSAAPFALPSAGDQARPGGQSAQDLAGEFARERRESPGLAWDSSRARLCARAATGLLVMEMDRLARMRRLFDDGEPRLAPGSAVEQEYRKAVDSAEEIVAVHLLLSLRETFSRVALNAVFVMCVVGLLLVATISFPMQPRQVLLGLLWANVACAVVVGLSGLVALDRNGVLSDITQTSRDAINWNWALVRRVLIYAVLPLLSMLAVQFPEIGQAIAEWLDPVQKTML
jgi:hypothetical protein